MAWLRPPNSDPIPGSDAVVSSRARWIATWRGHAMRSVRRSDMSSATEMPKWEATTRWMSLIVNVAVEDCGYISSRT